MSLRPGEEREMKNPRFLAFEGLDGSGKSTLINGVVAELRKAGIQLTLTREPGGTPLAEDIRKVLLRTDSEVPVSETELLLYAASRAQHVAKVIRPALGQGEWVLCDRFSASSVAFQSFARGVARASVDWLNRFAEQNTHPDLYVLLDLTVEESQRRQALRTMKVGQVSDRMERENLEFHGKVREGFLTQAKEDPSHWLVLDASLSPSELLTKAMSELISRAWIDKRVTNE
jgi:dTMP kinase